jgi:hypothetical protein
MVALRFDAIVRRSQLLVMEDHEMVRAPRTARLKGGPVWVSVWSGMIASVATKSYVWCNAPNLIPNK